MVCCRKERREALGTWLGDWVALFALVRKPLPADASAEASLRPPLQCVSSLGPKNGAAGSLSQLAEHRVHVMRSWAVHRFPDALVASVGCKGGTRGTVQIDWDLVTPSSGHSRGQFHFSCVALRPQCCCYPFLHELSTSSSYRSAGQNLPRNNCSAAVPSPLYPVLGPRRRPGTPSVPAQRVAGV